MIWYHGTLVGVSSTSYDVIVFSHIVSPEVLATEPKPKGKYLVVDLSNVYGYHPAHHASSLGDRFDNSRDYEYVSSNDPPAL